MPNPFFYGGRIADPQFFVGREAELRQIFSALETVHTGQMQPVSVVGPRRIGKSSLLYHLTQVYPRYLQQSDRYRFAYVDLDDPRCHTQAGLLSYILRQLNVSTTVQPTLAGFADALAQLQQGNACCTVVCLDEFEHLTQRKAEFPDEFFTALRSLAQNGQPVLITASKQPLSELFTAGGLTSPFHNIFSLLELGDLAEPEARALVERGLACDRSFTLGECDDLLGMAGQRPYPLQVACSLLYQQKAAPPVDWEKLKRDYRKQVDYALRAPPPIAQRARAGLPRLLRWLARSPQYLGRFILDVLKYDKASDSTAWLVGLAFIIICALLLFRILSLPIVLGVFKKAWRFFNPAK